MPVKKMNKLLTVLFCGAVLCADAGLNVRNFGAVPDDRGLDRIDNCQFGSNADFSCFTECKNREVV